LFTDNEFLQALGWATRIAKEFDPAIVVPVVQGHLHVAIEVTRNVYHAIFACANEVRYDRVVQFTADFNREHETSYTVDQSDRHADGLDSKGPK